MDAMEALNIAVLTVSDTRTEETDRSGQSLVRLQTRYAPQHPRSDRSTSSRNEHATVSFLGTR